MDKRSFFVILWLAGVILAVFTEVTILMWFATGLMWGNSK